MNYEGQICRSPMERSSYMLPVSVGCPYNRCRFCTLFKHLSYRELPLAQIEEELIRVADMGGNPSSVFLGDGNAFGLKTDRLLAVLDMIHRYFPGCQQVNMDATVTSISQKTDRELEALFSSGIRHLYLGIETGLEDVLSFMKKDHGLSEAYEQIHRITQSGFIFDAHIMTGVAGHGRGLENAQAAAEFFNRTKPGRIINFSMFLHREAPLYRSIEDGTFIPATELENLVEERQLLELLDDFPLQYDGFHDYIEVRIRGTLPKDRKAMLDKLEKAIQKQNRLAAVTAIL